MSQPELFDADKMKIKALAPWFGGKRTLAPKVVQQLGKHSQYFEPFCGSMAVLFAKERTQKETVNDLHGDLTNLATCLQYEKAAVHIYERCIRSIMSEGLLLKAKQYFEAFPEPHDESMGIDLDRAYWFFISSWMARNGTAGTARQDYQIAVRWTKNGGSPTVRFKNAVDCIPQWHARLSNVVILNRDAFRILDRFEDVKETAIYVDPPYPAETRSTNAVKNGRGGQYLHEFNHQSAPQIDLMDDHARLANILKEYKNARVVVSSYDCERMRNLYDGWQFLDCTMNKNLHAQNGRGARIKKAPEVLIVNGDLVA